MIVKSFELNKINPKNKNFYLFYGENAGHKNDAINNIFNTKTNENIYQYEEKEILDNHENFINSLISKSFFEDKKIIIVSRASDKMFDTVEELIEKNLEGVQVIINAGILERKSKLRNLFEKNKDIICVAFYPDNIQTLNILVKNFFREKKIPVSQQLINLLVERCRGDRQNLRNELHKIGAYTVNKKKIKLDEIMELTNLAENYNVSELIDNCLSKNVKKTISILNENNFSLEDCVLITRTLLMKSKRLYNLLLEIKNNKNPEDVISSFKPPIFWKDKDIVKQQIKAWNLVGAENLMYKTNELELLIKKNSTNAINIISDFIISTSNRINN